MNAQTIETMDDMKYIHIIAKNNEFINLFIRFIRIKTLY